MKNLIIGALLIAVVGLGALLFFKTDQANAPDSSLSTTENTQASSGKTLNLSNQGLISLPTDILDDSTVTTLDVSGNNLTGSLPSEIGKLENLEVLDASENNMTGIPAEIGKLSKLKVADFSNNDVTGLPMEIGNLEGLESLDLRGNPNLSVDDLSKIRSRIPNTQIRID